MTSAITRESVQRRVLGVYSSERHGEALKSEQRRRTCTVGGFHFLRLDSADQGRARAISLGLVF
jgi:hypothetical protein